MKQKLTQPAANHWFGMRAIFAAALVPALLLALSIGWYLRAAAAAAEPNKEAGYPSTLGGGAPCGSCIAPEKLSWKTVIPPEKEPGEPLVISGRILLPDGSTPAKGFVLYVFHTDVTGYYNEKDDASHPRLRGWMEADAEGKYEFRTIRPGAYPHRATPAHIHAHIYGPGYSERTVDDYWFEGDARINDQELEKQAKEGGHPVIVPLKRDADGIWRGVRDIQLPTAK